jgi:excisionase family DNA binding protein
MNTYSVKEISEMLGTSQETVRRWIRDGKLNASQESRKGGNSVTEADFQKFLKKSPKYATIAAGAVAAAVPIVGVPLAFGGLVSGIVGAAAEKGKQENDLDPDEVMVALSEGIKQSEKNIKRKRETVAQLENEIAQEEKQVDALRDAIERIKESVNEEQ